MSFQHIAAFRATSLYLITLIAVLAASHPGSAYQYYSDPGTRTGNCSTCHGTFQGSTSPKGTVFPSASNHDMHRYAMGTTCALCHSSGGRFPVDLHSSAGTVNNVGVGCTGCHMPAGLRKHHKVNGITICGICHPNDPQPAPETTKPPYYGTVDTKVNNPGNTEKVANTNENWSVGDFLGLDNDGNNLYDLADYAVGPFRILTTTKQGNDVRIEFLTAGGRTNTIQSAGNMTGTFTNLSAPIGIPGVGLVTNNYLHVGGATNSSRFYRLTELVP